MTPSNSRLLYIDALRGVTMILVVYHHIVNQCLPETVVDKGLQCVRMPMFFFISGFIAYKELGYWTAINTALRLFKKFRVQVISTAIVFSAYYILVRELNPVEVFVNSGWRQYWFTIVLFEFFVVYFLVNFFTHRSPKLNVIVFVFIIVASIVVFHTTDKTGRWCKWVQFYGFTRYMFFFVLGTFARRYFDTVKLILTKRWFIIVDALMFASQLVVYFLCMKDIVTLPHRVISFMEMFTMRITGVIMVFALFVKFEKAFTRTNLLIRPLIFIGGRTLDIYFLHFFFIYNIRNIYNYVGASGGELWGRLFTILTAGLVVVGCVLVSGLIRKWRFAGKLLFGAKY